MYISIKKISTFITGLTIVAIVLAGFMLFSLTQRISDAGEAAANRFYSILLVNELRKSSGELTGQVRGEEEHGITGDEFRLLEEAKALFAAFGGACEAGAAKIMALINEFESRVQTRTQIAMNDAEARKNTAIILSILALAFVFLLASVNFIYNRIYVVGPISSLSGKVKHMSKNDLTGGIDINLKHNNELSDLVNYFNQTLAKITALLIYVRKEADSMTSVGGELANNLIETAAVIDEISEKVQHIKTKVFSQGTSVKQTNVNSGIRTVNKNSFLG